MAEGQTAGDFVNTSPAAQRHSRLLNGETSTKIPKYQAVSGVVNTNAPIVAEKMAATVSHDGCVRYELWVFAGAGDVGDDQQQYRLYE